MLRNSRFKFRSARHVEYVRGKVSRFLIACEVMVGPSLTRIGKANDDELMADAMFLSQSDQSEA